MSLTVTRFYIVILQDEALPHLVYFQSSSSGENNVITSDVAKKQYYVRISTKFGNAYQHLCCSFIKMKTNCAARNFNLMVNFELMINFDLL